LLLVLFLLGLSVTLGLSSFWSSICSCWTHPPSSGSSLFT
jgi:hypothetical protein